MWYRACLSLVDTLSTPKTNETPNEVSQLAMIFTTQASVAMKITAQVNGAKFDWYPPARQKSRSAAILHLISPLVLDSLLCMSLMASALLLRQS